MNQGGPDCLRSARQPETEELLFARSTDGIVTIIGQSIIRTPDQRLRVFVSSALHELVDERAAARRAINNLRLAPRRAWTGRSGTSGPLVGSC
jgi:hypothetical protein